MASGDGQKKININTGQQMIDVKNDKILSEAYLDYVRSKPCVGCGKEPCDAHHVRPKGTGSGWQNDFTAAPFCRNCHNEWHRKGQMYFEMAHKVNVWRECFYLLLDFYVAGLPGSRLLGAEIDGKE